MHKDEVADEINAVIDKTETVSSTIEQLALDLEQLRAAISLLALHDSSELTERVLGLASSMFHEMGMDKAKLAEIRSQMDRLLGLL